MSSRRRFVDAQRDAVTLHVAAEIPYARTPNGPYFKKV